MKKCEHNPCNNEFKYRSNKRFCSRSCKQKAKDSRLQKVKFKKRPYLKFRKTYCEFCGFIAIHSCQLDVDHIDGNHKNNNSENLQTLCANCHRLKTYLNKDWEK